MGIVYRPDPQVLTAAVGFAAALVVLVIGLRQSRTANRRYLGPFGGHSSPAQRSWTAPRGRRRGPRLAALGVLAGLAVIVAIEAIRLVPAAIDIRSSVADLQLAADT